MTRRAVRRPLRTAVGGFALACLLAAAPRGTPAQEKPTPTPAAPKEAKVVQQVRVEVRLLEWQLSNSMDFDFAVFFTGNVLTDPDNSGAIVSSGDLSLPSNRLGSRAARFFLDGMDTGYGVFDAVIETLERAGEVEVLFETALIVGVEQKAGLRKDGKGKDIAEGYDGRVTHGSKIPYESVKAFGGVHLATMTEYQDTGVTLECSAGQIKYGEFVELDLRMSVADLSGFINIGNDSNSQPLRVPVLESREMRNKVLVRDRTVFIAGLLKSTREVERRQGIPWISEIPVLRTLLSNLARDKETTELVFLVRPEILAPVEIGP